MELRSTPGRALMELEEKNGILSHRERYVLLRVASGSEAVGYLPVSSLPHTHSLYIRHFPNCSVGSVLSLTVSLWGVRELIPSLCLKDGCVGPRSDQMWIHGG